MFFFFFSSRRRHTRYWRDWSSDVCSSDLVWLRGQEQGFQWTLLLFAVTWAADIFAFAVGSVLKGPKLRPAFSPNKTFSGFFGGLAFATLAGLAADALLGLDIPWGWAAAIGFVGGFATMAGDL